jgi:CheY-like chemotaxis protein
MNAVSEKTLPSEVINSNKKQILVVDDDTIMRETIRDILLFEGFLVTSVEGGNSAIKQISQQQFDLIVTDILMPERDGFEVINEAKKAFPDTKVIAISGGGYISPDSYLSMAQDIGADDVVSKPFDVEVFIQKVYRVLNFSK